MLARPDARFQDPQLNWPEKGGGEGGESPPLATGRGTHSHMICWWLLCSSRASREVIIWIRGKQAGPGKRAGPDVCLCGLMFIFSTRTSQICSSQPVIQSVSMIMTCGEFISGLGEKRYKSIFGTLMDAFRFSGGGWERLNLSCKLECVMYWTIWTGL